MEKIDPSLLHLFLAEPIYMTPEPGHQPKPVGDAGQGWAEEPAPEPGPPQARAERPLPVSAGLAATLAPAPAGRRVLTLPGHGTMPLPVIAGGILLLVHHTDSGPLPAEQALMLHKIAEALNFGPGKHTIEIGDVRRFAIAPGLAGCDAALVIVIGAPEASIAGMGLTPMQKRYPYGRLEAIAMPSAANLVANAPLRKVLWDEIKGLKR